MINGYGSEPLTLSSQSLQVAAYGRKGRADGKHHALHTNIEGHFTVLTHWLTSVFNMCYGSHLETPDEQYVIRSRAYELSSSV